MSTLLEIRIEKGLPQISTFHLQFCMSIDKTRLVDVEDTVNHRAVT